MKEKFSWNQLYQTCICKIAESRRGLNSEPGLKKIYYFLDNVDKKQNRVCFQAPEIVRPVSLKRFLRCEVFAGIVQPVSLKRFHWCEVYAGIVQPVTLKRFLWCEVYARIVQPVSLKRFLRSEVYAGIVQPVSLKFGVKCTQR